MSEVLDRAVIVPSSDVLPPAEKRNGKTDARVHCFHCGEICPDLSFATGDKTFCCQGCLIVHDLLAQSGLEQFYDLSSHPGVRMSRAAQRDKWNFLDEPKLAERLLDFTDGKTSRITLHIPAIHCIACVWLLENLFRLNPGIARSQVNFPRREVSIQFAAEKIRLSELVALLASIGYEPALTLGELEKQKPGSGRKRQWLQIGVAGFAFGNIMLFSLPRYLGLDSFSGEVFARIFGYLSLLLAIPVIIYSAADYWKSALLSIRQRVLTLDVPIALGLAAIYGTSAFEILTRTGEGYCDSLTGLIFFLLCGRAFQQRTHEQIAFDRDYKSFFPLSVTRRNSDQTEEHAALSELRVGDRILLRNSELIPADSKLVAGAATIDYSFVTGESEPVAKAMGDYLYAGGKQIGAAIEVEIIKPVSQSYLTSLWNHEAFQKDRDSNLNTLTNLYSRRFTLIVITVAVLAAVFWTATGNFPRGLKAFASVLIVACPCALALAAPFTLGTAQRVLARLNVFVKNSLVLERMAKINSVVFDKTGTLTTATDSNEIFDGETLTDAEKALVLAVARQSTHPYSQKIVESVRTQAAARPLDAFGETPGQGLKGKVDGHEVLLGSRKWLESHGVICTRNAAGVQLAVDGRHRGTFVIGNTIRARTEHLLQGLADHYELALLSGDNEREREIFRSLFGDNAALHFNQSPLDKLNFIRNLHSSDKTVMMVGDGLNDAGALKQSEVGVAVVEKVGAFSPASDVIIEASRVPQLSRIMDFARASTRIVRLSFAVSAAYNLIGISIAAAGILSPIICAVLMPLSSATVVLFAVGTTTLAAKRMGLLQTEDQ